MARNYLSIENPNNDSLTIREITHWFINHGFENIVFEGNSFEITTTYGGRPVYHKLLKNTDYQTYAKEAFGGSILVFEIQVTPYKINIECYAPMQILGFINKELSFKENASWITKYRKEGYKVMIALEKYILNKINE